MRVAAELHLQTGAWPVGEVAGHERGAAPVEGERGHEHAAVADRDELGHPGRGLLLEDLDGVGTSGARGELGVPRARRLRPRTLARGSAIRGGAVRRRRQHGALDLGHAASLHQAVTSRITQIG
jgi:hypothetical protein